MKSGFQVIKTFFNSKKSNKIFTRNEYFAHVEFLAPRIKESYMDTVRCYLENAGYLKNEEPGVYRKMKKIPEDLTLTGLQREAYPNARRYK